MSMNNPWGNGSSSFGAGIWGDPGSQGKNFFDDGNQFANAYRQGADALGGNTPFKNFVMARQGAEQTRYGAAQAGDPFLKQTDFLGGQGQQDLQQDYAGLNPSDRKQYGGSPGVSLGRMRWL
jgi:hypothetical protein